MDQLRPTKQAIVLGSYFHLLWFAHNLTSVNIFSYPQNTKTPAGAYDFDDYKTNYTPQGLYERLYDPLYTDFFVKYMSLRYIGGYMAFF